MRDTTKKLSGAQKDKFLERLIASEPGISDATASSLTRRATGAVSSLHVRAQAYEAVRRAVSARKDPPRPASPAAAAPAPPSPAEPAASLAEPTVPPAAPPAAKPFDAYAFGLVPLYQKEGREALLARLGAIGSADHLRQMARAQQVSLPAELRAGDVAVEVLRAAIADAVAKRIADRRAAAG